MELKDAFGLALRQFRKSKEMTQEDFSHISSRTYLSTLERGVKSPTLEKIDDLSKTMGIHPVSLVAECYLRLDELTVEQLLSQVRSDLRKAAHYERNEPKPDQ